jgi:quinol monooxygenase YgiN
MLNIPQGSEETYSVTAVWRDFFIEGITTTLTGTFGENLTWTYHPPTATLTINGTGAMPDFASAAAVPWNDFRFKIERLVLNDGLTTVGNYAFSDCVSLKSVMIADGAGDLTFNNLAANSTGPFQGCPVEKVYMGRNIVRSGGAWLLFGTGISDLTIGNSVTGVPLNAFVNCKDLSSVTIGNSVVNIGSLAFMGCTGLTEVVNYATIPQVNIANIFTDVTLSAVSLYVPENSISDYEKADVWKDFGNIAAIVKSVKIFAQNGAIYEGTTGSASFAVNTSKISNGEAGSVTWYTTPEGTTAASAPDGITAQVSDVLYNEASVTLTSTTEVRQGTYYFRVTIDEVTSDVAALTVSVVVHADMPAITEHPRGATYNLNETANALFITATVSDGGNLTYQRYRNESNDNTGGSEISGGTGITYIPSTATVGTLYYYVVITNTNNSVNGIKTATTTSNTAAVTVNALVNAQMPEITAHPQPATYSQNATATALTVTASVSDGGTLTYQWYRNATNSTTGGTAAGTGASYTPATATVGTQYYYVVITNTNNSVNGIKTATTTSNTAEITVIEIVNAQMPNIAAHPQSAIYSQNTTAAALTVTASVTDGGVLSYQWYSNTTNSTTGGTAVGTGASYTPATATAGTQYYYVSVTNTNNSVNGVQTATATSNAAAIEVRQVTGTEITDVPLARVYPNPTDGVITIETMGHAPLSNAPLSEGYALTLSDMNGKVLLRQTVSDKITQLDLSNYPSGVYFLTIDDGKRQSAMRIVKD